MNLVTLVGRLGKTLILEQCKMVRKLRLYR